MAVITNSTASWSPSQLQKGVHLDSNNPGSSALQAMVDAENRAWLTSKNYLFSYVRSVSVSTLDPSANFTVFRFRAHNPVGLVNLRFQVRGRYVAGTGAQVRLHDNGVNIATINLTTTTTNHTATGIVGGLGDRTYTIQVQTQLGSTAEFPGIWVSWGTFV
jgi:hypothetical protein